MSTLELLIAFAVLTLSISAVIMVVFSNQSVAIDMQTNIEALSKAQAQLEQARAGARKDFNSIVSTTTTSTSTIAYKQTLAVSDLTQCKKQVTSSVSWNNQGRVLKIDLTTFLTDIAGALALGGDCITDSPSSNWENPKLFASDTINPGKPTALDVLNRIAYLSIDVAPFLAIADTRGATLGQNNGLFVTFMNGFNAGAKINALDAVFHSPTGKRYIFATMDMVTDQLKVIDVTDIHNPVLVATRTLNNVNQTGSYPQGYRVSYFKDRLYVITRETSGREFHIFNVSQPTNPTELGQGTELGITVNDIAMQERFIGGATKRFAYMATSQDSAELKVYDITDPTSNGTISEITAVDLLPGVQNGLSVFLVGTKLYLGRQSASGPDLYVYDVSNPPAGLTLLGSKDIGTGVLAIRVAGRFAFLSTPQAQNEFQVWNISNLASISLIKKYNFGNIVDQGIDYEPDFVYATGQATPNFQMLYSP